jgi:hypothetical protein
MNLEMDQIETPSVTPEQIAEALAYAKDISPSSASFEQIETVGSWTGRILVAQSSVPYVLIDWLYRIPAARLIATHTIVTMVIANAHHIHVQRVQHAIYARVVLSIILERNIERFANPATVIM